jgi:FKBP-type peptidyl-prolyl cis-trans isomerase FkpA
MRKNLMFFTLAAVGLASCNSSGYKKGENGILYNIFIDKPGPKIQEGDFVMANVVIKTDADSVIYSTSDHAKGEPMLIQQHQFKGDLLDGMKLLTEGDSAAIRISADTIFKKPGSRPPAFKGKSVTYIVKIEKLIPKGKLTDQAFQANVESYMTEQNNALKNQEPAIIKSYIADKKLTVTKTDSGLYYVINKKGTGPLVAVGDTAVVNYTGSLLSGKVFDTSIKDDAIKAKISFDPRRRFEPIRVPVGQKRVIAGWDQGLQLLNKGAKATFIVPSSLAYGDSGYGQIGIGPSTPLAFDVEVVDIIHPNPNASKPAVTAMQPGKK